MRRMSNADHIRRNKSLIILAVALLFIGISFPLFVMLAPTVEYEDLLSREIVVEKLELIRQNKGSDFFRITTQNGERYNITGKYEQSHVEELLTRGTRASVKYYEGFLSRGVKCAEVIFVDRKCVSAYDNDEGTSLWGLLLFAGISFFFVALILSFVVWEVKRFRRMQEMRDKRIAKKYGSANKNQIIDEKGE